MKSLVALIITLLVTVQVNAQLVIQLPQEEIALEYSIPVRLSQVLSDIPSFSQTITFDGYSIANKMFNHDKHKKASQLKQTVLNRLQEQLSSDLTKNKTIGALIEQVRTWPIGYREFVSLDYDQVRLHPKNDPLLSGRFELVQGMRTSTISIEGAVYQASKVSMSANQTLSDYLTSVKLLPEAHKSYAWVIYPDGESKRVGYAYWNDEGVSLTPGSTIFIGLDSDSDETIELEKSITQLLSMRKDLP